jgi:hypothetical protein
VAHTKAEVPISHHGHAGSPVLLAHLARGSVHARVSRRGRARAGPASPLRAWCTRLYEWSKGVISRRVGARLSVCLFVMLQQVVEVGQDLAAACEVAHKVCLKFGKI